LRGFIKTFDGRMWRNDKACVFNLVGFLRVFLTVFNVSCNLTAPKIWLGCVIIVTKVMLIFNAAIKIFSVIQRKIIINKQKFAWLIMFLSFSHTIGTVCTWFEHVLPVRYKGGFAFLFPPSCYFIKRPQRVTPCLFSRQFKVGWSLSLFTTIFYKL